MSIEPIPIGLLCVCVSLGMCVCVRVRVCMCMCMCVRACVRACALSCARARACACACLCVRGRVCVCLCLCLRLSRRPSRRPSRAARAASDRAAPIRTMPPSFCRLLSRPPPPRLSRHPPRADAVANACYVCPRVILPVARSHSGAGPQLRTVVRVRLFQAGSSRPVPVILLSK